MVYPYVGGLRFMLLRTSQEGMSGTDEVLSTIIATL
jgi:hypothetical protein